ncbi:MAG TPA: hypothetical protein VHK65_07990 [Candidatus Dormibacteraeota bacterium]|nr:hypothetical protein [Candidatus Dormibacteraeota bacterium]
MLATYDVRRSPTRALAISFALTALLIIGGAVGFAVKGLTQGALISRPASVVVSSLAGPMVSGRSAAQMTRIELNDERSQAQSVSVPTVGTADHSNHANPRFGPR